MKVFHFTLFIAFTFSLYSCHGDREDEATSIQYRITAEESILSEAAYRSADGSIRIVQGLDGLTLWHTTEFVSDDFDVHLKATFENVFESGKSYKLWCFVEGELVLIKEGIAPPMEKTIVELNYSHQ
ncbi:hypothetical protein [Flavobacterium sp. AG291]|uniref:hypothetical protein n=1 Tax=Flavobacterium sp. AG291 TaxID=2184000 RepID=UPI000E0BD6A7|nr:hypothetical protein [Flavobacterium sp. AG291]RDI10441.1 hypothetical protein DEU42_107100 [Flavobacterium sp. AG291]